MEGKEWIWVVIFIVSIIVLAILYAILKIRKFSRDIMAEDFIEAYKEMKKKSNEVPKSLSGMDKVYGPQITRDFPDINLYELKKRSENSLLQIFNAIESKDLKELSLVSELIVSKVDTIIKEQKRLGLSEYFDNVKFHNTVISQYIKDEGYRSIVFQTSVEYFHYIKKDNEIVNGSKDSIQQDRFEISIAYIQDMDKLDESVKKMGVFGRNCVNCAAPIKTLGQKYCEYCGTAILELNIKSWIMIDFIRK